MPSSAKKTSLQQCRDLLDRCWLLDRQKFVRQIQKHTTQKSPKQSVDNLLKAMHTSIERVEQRIKNYPLLQFPEDLPVSQKKDEIREAIDNHQVIILCGETGSGKTTQLPKICLQRGSGSRGLMCHTQPRRLAARAVASRIAEELNTELGAQVGYKVRFTDQVSEQSYIKLVTDGILLAEIHHDPYLSQYDTIIVDEAHERSLNIDFLLGYLKRLLPKRPDLKLIITSATIDPERFSSHFNKAPIIMVSGRTYPVEVRYHPLHGDDEDERQKDLVQGISDAIDELSRLDRSDILVFLSGERDIREATQFLQKRQLPNTEILPLLARLSAAEQNRIFHTSSKRRIVLSTNVAETSLTVPGIKYVIDSGVARISRYSWHSKIQRLPVEKISQASANQRKGRCGRVSEGVCIRLYSEEDFANRPEFTDPEIQRTNLASVILQMENMQLGHVEDFPFIEPPDGRLVRDGYKLLFELGALDDKQQISKLGKQLSRLPIEPRIGRMLLEADKESSLSEVLIIASALAVQDPRERPMDKQQAADEVQKIFQDNRSDFLGFLNLWQAYQQQKKQLSSNKLRKWFKDHFISWLRMREWLDTHRQIKHMLKDLHLRFNSSEANYDAIHRALLSGLLGNLGFKDDKHQYLGARNRRFQIFPGSALFNKGPKWLMAAEIVETSRVYARTIAKVDPLWVEQKAQHLLKRSYTEPHWEKRNAQVAAFECSTLYGLIIHPQRKINYGPVAPAESREIFIRSALVNGDFDCRDNFFQHNQSLIEQLQTLEAKSRRQDILVDEDSLFNFYDQRIPENIYSGPQFFKWLKTIDTDTLKLTREQLMQHDANGITGDQFPDFLELNGARYPLEYHFDPSHKRDGITLITPLAGLNPIEPSHCEWLVPGMLHEKMVQLIRSLPKQLRKNFVPAPNFADICMETLQPSDLSLTTAMSNQLKKITGTEIPYDAWQLQTLDDHLIMNIRVIDSEGNSLAEGRNLQLLKNQLAGIEPEPITDTTEQNIEQDEVGPEILDNFPDEINVESQGIQLKLYPALHKEGSKVALRLYHARNEADHHHHTGIRQLYINALPEQVRQLKSSLPGIHQLCMHYTSLGKCDELKQAILDATIDQLFTQHQVNSTDDFQRIRDEGRSEMTNVASDWCQLLSSILKAHHQIRKQLKNPPLSWLDAMNDIQNQINHLFPANFITLTEREWLEQYPRYLKGIELRLNKIQDNPTRDRKCRLEFESLWNEYDKRAQQIAKQHIDSPQLNYYRWMLEEYRISLFAQTLKTLFPVSVKRLKQYWSDISDA